MPPVRCRAPRRSDRPAARIQLDGAILPALALARRELAMDAALVTEISTTSETVRWALVNGWPSGMRVGRPGR